MSTERDALIAALSALDHVRCGGTCDGPYLRSAIKEISTALAENPLTDEQILSCLDERQPVRQHHGAAIFEYRLFALVDFARRVLAAASIAPAQRDRDLHAALFDTGESLKDIWRATTATCETCHFGNHATAVAWAGKGGKVERATFPVLVVEPSAPVANPLHGEAPGHPLPDWPEWCSTFRERKAYQQGIADARALRAPATDAEIDLIAADGMRNAAGGIYATSVYEFARGIEAHHGINPTPNEAHPASAGRS